MTDQIKAMLDEAARSDEPASSIQGEEVVRLGRRRNRVHQFGLAGGATLGLSAVVAVALVLAPTTGGTPADDRGAAAGAVEQPRFQLPDIDMKDGYDYLWAPYLDRDEEYPAGTSTETAETERFGAAFWRYVSDNFDDVEVVRPDDAEHTVLDPVSEENRAVMTRDLMQVNESRNTESVPLEHDPLPRYVLEAEISLDRTDVVDTVELAVHPKGSFEAGPGPRSGYRNLYTCEDQGTGSDAVERDCETTTGPDGEKVVHVTTTYQADGETVHDRFLVVYRADGTAVTIGDVDTRRFEDGTPTREAEPTLDFARLTELAFALPDDVLVR